MKMLKILPVRKGWLRSKDAEKELEIIGKNNEKENAREEFVRRKAKCFNCKILVLRKSILKF